MNIFRKIEKVTAGFVLRKEFKKVKRIRKLVNLHDAKEIGVLFIVNDKAEYNKVSKFINLLQNENKNVKALAFVKSKNLKEQIMPKLSYDLFTSKNLNWFKKPLGVFVKDFIEKKFDILINLDYTDCFPIQYLLALSHAKLKVGIDDTKSADYLDIMIKTKLGSDLDLFTNEVVHYLSILKNKDK
ncbi:MAG: hypothetical protein K8R41_07195 [Bacteroidales bacterium]|nr:hypothetical protein [Bacteroidales bacterium]